MVLEHQPDISLVYSYYILKTLYFGLWFNGLYSFTKTVYMAFYWCFVCFKCFECNPIRQMQNRKSCRFSGSMHNYNVCACASPFYKSSFGIKTMIQESITGQTEKNKARSQSRASLFDVIHTTGLQIFKSSELDWCWFYEGVMRLFSPKLVQNILFWGQISYGVMTFFKPKFEGLINFFRLIS